MGIVSERELAYWVKGGEAMREQMPSEREVLGRLMAWAEAEATVRAVLMTSSRTRPAAPVDALSDYDVILVVANAAEFTRDDAWQSVYGRPLVRWGDQGREAGFVTHFTGVVYEDFVKIDYTVWPQALLQHVTATGVLLPELDAGYKVLLDKDAQTVGWPAPSYRAYVPARPSAAEYQALVEEFWWSATYVAKSLWRDELVFAHWCLDNELRVGTLRRMLEWRIELDHDWSLRPGVLGRGLKPHLPPALWAALEATYTGPSLEAHWQALLGVAAVFGQVAREVGAALGYAYPEEIDLKMQSFFQALRALPPRKTEAPGSS